MPDGPQLVTTCDDGSIADLKRQIQKKGTSQLSLQSRNLLQKMHNLNITDISTIHKDMKASPNTRPVLNKSKRVV